MMASHPPAAVTAAHTSSANLLKSSNLESKRTSSTTQIVLHAFLSTPRFPSSIASHSRETPTSPPGTCHGSRGTNKPGTTLDRSAGTPATARRQTSSSAPRVSSDRPSARSTAAASAMSTSPWKRSRSNPSTSAARSVVTSADTPGVCDSSVCCDSSESKSPPARTVAIAR